MTELKGACLIAQSGGPTSVINASLYGAVTAALEDGRITRVLGAAHGVKGILDDVLWDLTKEDRAELDLLPNTPSSILGSCRYKLADPGKDDKDYRRILEIFRKYDVRYFFYIGGNDSMDTCDKVSRFMASSGWDCRVMGIPKTIDNDLNGTDHCPGFASAAKYIATTCMEISRDAGVYDYPTATVVEIMGRHTGWLAGSAALATLMGDGPDLIYLPELPFDLQSFYQRAGEVLERKGNLFVAVSEGIRDKNGVFLSEYASRGGEGKDAFGHVQLGGLAAWLANEIKQTFGVKTRGIELSLMQRCGAHLASRRDIDEAIEAGRRAVRAALEGENGKMAAYTREIVNGEVRTGFTFVPLTEAANLEKKVPEAWILPEGAGVTREFADYVLPLIQGDCGRQTEQGLPKFARLKQIRA